MDIQKYIKYTLIDGMELLVISSDSGLFKRSKIVAERSIGEMFYKQPKTNFKYLIGLDKNLTYTTDDKGHIKAEIKSPTHLILENRLGFKRTTSPELIAAEYDLTFPSGIFLENHYKNIDLK